MFVQGVSGSVPLTADYARYMTCISKKCPFKSASEFMLIDIVPLVYTRNEPTLDPAVTSMMKPTAGLTEGNENPSGNLAIVVSPADEND